MAKFEHSNLTAAFFFLSSSSSSLFYIYLQHDFERHRFVTRIFSEHPAIASPALDVSPTDFPSTSISASLRPTHITEYSASIGSFFKQSALVTLVSKYCSPLFLTARCKLIIITIVMLKTPRVMSRGK